MLKVSVISWCALDSFLDNGKKFTMSSSLAKTSGLNHESKNNLATYHQNPIELAAGGLWHQESEVSGLESNHQKSHDTPGAVSSHAQSSPQASAAAASRTTPAPSSAAIDHYPHLKNHSPTTHNTTSTNKPTSCGHLQPVWSFARHCDRRYLCHYLPFWFVCLWS